MDLDNESPAYDNERDSLRKSTEKAKKLLAKDIISSLALKKVPDFKPSLQYLISKYKVHQIKSNTATIQSFLLKAYVKIKAHTLKESKKSHKIAEKVVLSDLNLPENYLITEDSHPRSSIRQNSAGASSLIDTLQQEIRTLDYTLTREKEKNRSLQEELHFYKNNYETTLNQLQELQAEGRNSSLSSSTITRDSKIKGAEQLLQRELQVKTTDIDLLTLKISNLNQHIEEQDETIEEYKNKELKWRKNLEIEIVKYNEEIRQLKYQIYLYETSKKEETQMEKDIKFLKSEVKNLKSQNTELKDQVLKLEHLSYELTESESALKTTIKMLKSELLEKDKHVRNLEDRNIEEEVNAACQDSQKIIESQREEIELLQEQNETYRTEVGRMSSMEMYYKDEITKMGKILKEKSLQIKVLQSEIEDLHTEKANITRMLIEQESQKKILKEEESNKVLDQSRYKIAELTKEIQSISEELHNSKELYSTLLSIIKLKNMEISIYKHSPNQDGDFQSDISKLKTAEKELLEMLRSQTDKLTPS
ncbi:hypothetical protein SteCoe_23671 [Stentor coeruleus]|uniref:Uncharacterized protein n=1 Tax=Stentor coeruleus TaxID=5963 RepID=A0A1R2BJF6_9CILI|nr:hypothetical protein SteCoe_23671 [Stentor coeruleus]